MTRTVVLVQRYANLRQQLFFIALVCSYILGAANLSAAQQTASAPGPESAAQPAAAELVNQEQVSPTASSYDALIDQAQMQLTAHQSKQAQALAERAIRESPYRYEAHVIASTALRDQRLYGLATAHLQTALALAPDELKTEILRAITEVRLAALSPDGRRQMDALRLVLDDASKATSDARTRLLHEFMTRSTAFLETNPSAVDLWMVRAQVALELDYPEVGWIAGRKLKDLGVANSDDPTIRNLMAQLERKEWLGPGFLPPLQKEQEDVCGIHTPPNNYDFSAGIARADAGDAYCANVIGHIYQSGGGTGGQTVDESRALKYLTEAAEQGFATADQHVAEIYGFGQVVDTTRWAEWTRKAAELGLAESLDYVSNWYIVGRDAPQIVKDPAKSVQLEREAAEQGYTAAEVGLARAYRHGEGVEQNDTEAMRWYRSAGKDALELKDTAEENQIARMLSTDPMPQYRDGKEALRLALAACDSTSNSSWALLDTLAAAYAEAGTWDNAVRTEQQAMDVGRKASKYKPDPTELKAAQARLDLYRNKRPYREQ